MAKQREKLGYIPPEHIATALRKQYNTVLELVDKSKLVKEGLSSNPSFMGPKKAGALYYFYQFSFFQKPELELWLRASCSTSLSSNQIHHTSGHISLVGHAKSSLPEISANARIDQQGILVDGSASLTQYKTRLFFRPKVTHSMVVSLRDAGGVLLSQTNKDSWQEDLIPAKPVFSLHFMQEMLSGAHDLTSFSALSHVLLDCLGRA